MIEELQRKIEKFRKKLNEKKIDLTKERQQEMEDQIVDMLRRLRAIQLNLLLN